MIKLLILWLMGMTIHAPNEIDSMFSHENVIGCVAPGYDDSWPHNDIVMVCVAPTIMTSHVLPVIDSFWPSRGYVIGCVALR